MAFGHVEDDIMTLHMLRKEKNSSSGFWTKSWRGHFLPKNGHKSVKNVSIKNPKNTSGAFDSYYHFPKFEENSSSRFGNTLINGRKDKITVDILLHSTDLIQQCLLFCREMSTDICRLSEAENSISQTDAYPRHIGYGLSAGNLKNTSEAICQYYHFPKFEQNSSSRFWDTSLNGQNWWIFCPFLPNLPTFGQFNQNGVLNDERHHGEH